MKKNNSLLIEKYIKRCIILIAFQILENILIVRLLFQNSLALERIGFPKSVSIRSLFGLGRGIHSGLSLLMLAQKTSAR